MTRVLVIRLSAMGDVLMTLPLVRALKAGMPGVRIDFATQSEWAPLLEGHPDLERVVEVPVGALRGELPLPWRWPSAWRRYRRLGRGLSGARYDVVLDAHGNTKSGLVARLAAAPRTVGPARAEARELGAWFHDSRPPAPPSTRRHRRARALALLGPLGLATEDLGAALPEYPQGWARGVLGDLGRVALLHPGTSPRAAFKRWSPAAFGALARDLAADGWAVRVVAGPGEEELARDVATASSGIAQALPVPPGLRELGGLLSEAGLFVGADSGPAHLASLLGVPTVTLFGPKDPSMYGPLGQGVAVVNPVACHPCGLRRCPLARVECMADLRPSTVVEACRVVVDREQLRGLALADNVRMVRQR